MNPGTEQRKLATIMFTDMVGCSALPQRNEARPLECAQLAVFPVLAVPGALATVAEAGVGQN